MPAAGIAIVALLAVIAVLAYLLRQASAPGGGRQPVGSGGRGAHWGRDRVATDISELKRTEESLRAAKEDAERAPRRGRGGEPHEGRVPRHPLARAAHAAQRHPRLGAASCAPASSSAGGLAAGPRGRSSATPGSRPSSSRTCSTSRASSPASCGSTCSPSTWPRSSRRRSTPCAPPPRPRAIRAAAGARPRRRPGARATRPAPAGRLEPALQRRQVHAQGRPGRGPPRARSTRTSRSASATPARASRPSSCRTSSSASARPTPRRPAGTAGWASGSRSSSHLVELHGGTVAAKSAGRGPGRDVHRRPAARRRSTRPRTASPTEAAPTDEPPTGARRPHRSPGCACWSSTTSPTPASLIRAARRRRARRSPSPPRVAEALELLAELRARRPGQRHRHARARTATT